MKKKSSLTKTQDFIASARQSLLDSSLIAQTNKFLYDIKIYKCGNYVQIYTYENQHLKKNDSLCPVTMQKSTLLINNNSIISKEKQKVIRIDNIIRSKLSLQRLVKTNINIFKTFITLTFAENITGIEEANKIFNIWRTSAKKLFLEFKYICAPEFQKRGAVHYHLITNIPLDNGLIIHQNNKKNCFNVKYWNNGFSSVYSLKNINVVTYISKYLTKNIDNRLFSHKRYFNSKNLTFPKVEYLNTSNIKTVYYLNKLLKNKILCYTNKYIFKYTNEEIKFKEFKY